ncbi:MAG TPA: hypothetical protein VNZ53_26520 [Steroidobacteraceae bacterium]|jgi:hypothetical protein|nr:hypothetical protein [Steroidobacteraceae bacterium]
MTDRAPALDDATMKFGLLMESAQAHQRLAESQLEKLRAHTRDLDGVVRDEIRRTLIDEMQMLTAESRRAIQVLQRIRRGAAVRTALWCSVMAILCTGIPITIIRCVLPSESEIAGMRARRDELAASVAALERRGGRIEWRRCGADVRLCVRVDRKAPAYGEHADFFVVAGY